MPINGKARPAASYSIQICAMIRRDRPSSYL
jgi:hypothetical protein